MPHKFLFFPHAMHAADISVNYGSKLRFKWLSSSKQHESSLDPLVRVIDSESWINLVPSQSQTGVQLSLCSYRPIQYTHHLGMIYHGNFLSRSTEVRFVRFLSGGFTTMALINPPDWKLENQTSVRLGSNGV